MPQTLPRSAEDYSRAQRRELAAALSATSRLWQRMGEDFDSSYTAIELPLLTTVYTAQGRMVVGASEYVPTVMAEVGMDVPDPAWESFPEAWAGTAGDGRPVSSLAYESVITARQAVATGASTAQALQSGGAFLASAVGTLLSDTARGAEKMEGAGRRVRTYVRMLAQPSCGRCVILAGRSYGASAAFLRHPRCDCRNVPAPESVAGDMTVDPDEYLGGLDDTALARTLGSQANAAAYREYGADASQLVNAYRRGGGVQPAQVYGRTVKYTTEGTTRRGWAYHRMAEADYITAQGVRRTGRNTRPRAPRMMPESIFQATTDEAERRRLLRLYGWVQ